MLGAGKMDTKKGTGGLFFLAQEHLDHGPFA